MKLVIYNVLGQPVRTLVDESRAAGTYQVKWDARDEGGVLLSTGVYIARLTYPGGVQTQAAALPQVAETVAQDVFA